MRNARKTRRRGVRIGFGAGLLMLLVAFAIAGCGGGDSSTSSGTSDSGSSGTSENASDGGSGGKLAVVGYSTPESVYADALEPAFTKTPQGQGVSFSNSFGASGDQSRAVVAGQE